MVTALVEGEPWDRAHQNVRACWLPPGAGPGRDRDCLQRRPWVRADRGEAPRAPGAEKPGVSPSVSMNTSEHLTLEMAQLSRRGGGRGPWLSQQDLRAIERPGVTGEGPGGAPGQVCSESVPRVPSSLPSFLLSIIFATLCKYKTCDALRGPEWSWIYGENEA